METARTSTEFSLEEMASIERFLIASTVPLVYQKDEVLGVLGTGTFFEQDGRHFLITAGHVFKDIDPLNLGVPERAGKNACVWNFGNAQIHHPRDTDEYDVAVVELQDRDFIALAQAGWLFLNRSNVISFATQSEQYLIAGYPNDTVQNISGVLTPSSLMQLYTGPYAGKENGDRGEFDLLLRYSRGAGNTHGVGKPTPDLGGVSGAAVYAVLPCVENVWAPENILKVVGIQVSFMHSKYVRAKSWALVSHIISLIPEN